MHGKQLYNFRKDFEMDKKYLIPAYIRRNAVMNWQLQKKPRTWKNSYWFCGLANLLIVVVFYGLGELLTKDLPRDIAAYTTICLFGVVATFVTVEVFDLKTDE